jgi:hypothetical protein
MVATLDMIPPSVEAELTECTLSREQLMLQIQSLNPTATIQHLARFSANALGLYLAHLNAACEPRGRMARWIRPTETPAIIGFETGDDQE